MDVGVRELKQHLSEYLRKVADGETVRVTDRGVPTALLVPIPGVGSLQRGIDEGWIRPPLHQQSIGDSEPAVGRRRILDLLNEDRGE